MRSEENLIRLEIRRYWCTHPQCLSLDADSSAANLIQPAHRKRNM